MKKVQSILFFLSLFLVGNACNNPNSANAKPVSNGSSITEMADEQGSPVFADLKVNAFKEKMEASENAILIDVRTAEEIAQGKIEGALEMDFYQDDFQNKILELDRDKTYFMYCRSGNRSGKASKFMIENGFMKVYNLDGGYNDWSK
jgi:rhodanese-related sulfurtransferase